MSEANKHNICVCVKCGPPWRNETKPELTEGLLKWWQRASWMALCPTCGSKRCAGALDHNEKCDGGS